MAVSQAWSVRARRRRSVLGARAAAGSDHGRLGAGHGDLWLAAIRGPGDLQETAKRSPFTLETPWADGTTSLMLSPTELIEKLAALVPPRRCNPIRCHGTHWYPAVVEDRSMTVWAPPHLGVARLDASADPGPSSGDSYTSVGGLWLPCQRGGGPASLEELDRCHEFCLWSKIDRWAGSDCA